MKDEHALADELAELRDFLAGATPLDGLHFGEAKQGSGRFLPRRALYWWRGEMRRRINAAIRIMLRPSPPPEADRLPTAGEVERVARAILSAMNQAPVTDEQWASTHNLPDDRETLLSWGRAAIAALSPQPAPDVVGLLREARDELHATSTITGNLAWVHTLERPIARIDQALEGERG
jgi:hypothetical protein